MPKKTPIPLRFEDQQLRSLEEIGEATGLDRPDLIRLAVSALIRHYHNSGDKLILPLNEEQVIKAIAEVVDEE